MSMQRRFIAAPLTDERQIRPRLGAAGRARASFSGGNS